MTNAEILNLMQEKCNFVDEITEDTFEKNIVIPLLDDLNLSYSYGATKIVLMIAEMPYVIKIPFSCAITEQGYYEPIIDYCKAEMDIYNKSKEENCEKFFLPVAEMGRVNGYPIYFQPYAEIEENDSEDLVVPMKHTTWYEIAKEKENFENFLNFCRKEKIEDLRAENLGYYNEEPVVVDYGGFI